MVIVDSLANLQP